MIAYDIDPSLHTSEPAPPTLDDGFSRRHHAEPAEELACEDMEATLPEKSDF